MGQKLAKQFYNDDWWKHLYQTGFPIEKMTIYLTNVVLTQEWVLNVGIYLGVKILFNSKIEDNRIHNLDMGMGIWHNKRVKN